MKKASDLLEDYRLLQIDVSRSSSDLLLIHCSIDTTGEWWEDWICFLALPVVRLIILPEEAFFGLGGLVLLIIFNNSYHRSLSWKRP